MATAAHHHKAVLRPRLIYIERCQGGLGCQSHATLGWVLRLSYCAQDGLRLLLDGSGGLERHCTIGITHTGHGASLWVGEQLFAARARERRSTVARSTPF